MPVSYTHLDVYKRQVDNGAGVTSSKDIVCTVRAEGYADATLDLDVSQAYQAIPETLYGVFFEDINHALDGGINAELIENGSFEAHGMNNGRFSFSNNVNTLDNWSKIAKDGASGSAQIDLENPMNENNTKCAVITIEDAGTGLGLSLIHILSLGFVEQDNKLYFSISNLVKNCENCKN